MGIFDKIKNTAFDPAVAARPIAPSLADDPIWAPINGVSQDYADLPAPQPGVTDEAGMIALARERGGTRPAPGRPGRLGAADGAVDGRGPAVPQAARLLTISAGRGA